MARRHLSYANVTATLALVLALGGVSYAAIRVPRNSVGSAQLVKGAVRNSDLANNAVTTRKIKNGTLRAADFRHGQLPRGPRGRQGPPGQLTASATLQSGQTEAGVYGADSPAGDAGYGTAVNFRIPLNAALVPGQVHFVGAGRPAPTECAGPAPTPGNLCVYETYAQPSTSFAAVYNPELYPVHFSIIVGASRYGFLLTLRASASGPASSFGRWAVTAP